MSLTAEQFEALICARNLDVQAGLELLDTGGALIEDISDDLRGWQVEYQRDLAVHWSATLDIFGERDWPNILFRPYQTLTAGSVSAQVYCGVYVPQRPQIALGSEPSTYNVKALSLLSLLIDPIGDSYEVASGTGYLAALRTILTARVAGAATLFDSTAEATALPAALNWILDNSSPSTWLGGPCTDLLKAIAYSPLWCDSLGQFRAEPWQDPLTRTPRRTLDVSGSGNADIVHPERTLTTEYGVDYASGRNWWRGTRRGMTTLPTEGAGQYTVDHSGGGIKHKKPWDSNATDQATLEIEVNKVVQEDTQAVRTLEITTGPQPDIGHLDVFGYTGDPRVGDVLAQVRSCTIPGRPRDGKVRMTLELLL